MTTRKIRSLAAWTAWTPFALLACATGDGSMRDAPTADPADHSQIQQPIVADDGDDGVQEVSDGAFVRDTGSGPQSVPLPPARRYAHVAASYEKPKLMNLPSVPSSLAAKRPVQLLIEQASTAKPDDLIPVSFRLSEIAVDWAPLRKLRNPVLRAAFVEGRKQQLAPTQAHLLSWLVSVGAKEIEPRWLTNSVFAHVPAKHVSAAVSHPDVVDASGSGKVEQGASWGGKQTQEAMRTSNLNNSNITGHSGGSGHRIVVAIIESGDPSNMLHRQHLGWKRRPWEPQTSDRLASVKNCNTNPCTNSTATQTTDNHGTRVTWVAAGSIESGQDPNFPGADTDDQRQRSGVAKDVYVRYYQAEYDFGLYRAIAQAIYDGADVMNLSLGSITCNNSYNSSDINAALDAALAYGIVPIACGGNSGQSPCTAWWPGTRPETLTVNGLDSDDTTKSYESLAMLDTASRGGLPVLTYGGLHQGYLSSIDLVAPGRFTKHFAPPGTSYSTGAFSGCSLAAPALTDPLGFDERIALCS